MCSPMASKNILKQGRFATSDLTFKYQICRHYYVSHLESDFSHSFLNCCSTGCICMVYWEWGVASTNLIFYLLRANWRTNWAPACITVTYLRYMDFLLWKENFPHQSLGNHLIWLIFYAILKSNACIFNGALFDVELFNHSCHMGLKHPWKYVLSWCHIITESVGCEVEDWSFFLNTSMHFLRWEIDWKPKVTNDCRGHLWMNSVQIPL